MRVSDAVLVGLVGIAVVTFFALRGVARLSWSDEIVYAAMGRNVAAGRGLISNFYDPRAILADGFPLADVHMPGHALALAVSFAALGGREWAAIGVSQLAFVLTGLILFRAAERVESRRAGALAAALYYVFPPAGTYANTAMSETTLTAFTAGYAALWLGALAAPRWGSLARLVTVFGIACLYRETSLLLLLPTLYLLARWPSTQRTKAALGFGLFLLLFLALVFGPLYASRAAYPHFLGELKTAHGAGEIAAVILNKAQTNLRRFRIPGSSAWQWTLTAQWAATLLAALASIRLSGRARQAGLLGAFLVFGTAVALLGFYPFWAWAGVRALMPLAPLGLVAVAVALARLPSRGLRFGLSALALAGAARLSLVADDTLAAMRRSELEQGQQLSRLIREGAADGRPAVVLARGAFRYGWDAYPVSVIWDWPTDEAALEALVKRVRIDLILLANPEAQPDLRRALPKLGFSLARTLQGAEVYRLAAGRQSG